MKKMLKPVMTLLLYFAAAYLLLVGIMFLLQEKLVFFPSGQMTNTPAVYNLEWEDIYFDTEDDIRLNGWYIPNEESSHIILFSHGNAGNISNRLPLLQMLHEHGFAVFIYDYRGFGNSEGRPNEKGVYKDIEAAWKHLINEKNYQPSEVILYGRSIGGSVSAYLAQKVDPAGVIMESAFTSARDVARDVYPFLPPGIVQLKFKTKEYLGNVRSPVLIMHSRDDEIIGFHHGEDLYSAAGNPKTFVELRGGHNDNFIESGEEYFRALKNFVEGLEN